MRRRDFIAGAAFGLATLATGQQGSANAKGTNSLDRIYKIILLSCLIQNWPLRIRRATVRPSIGHPPSWDEKRGMVPTEVVIGVIRM